MSFSHRVRKCLAVGTAGMFVATAVAAAPASAEEATPEEPENIIVMIADGMGYNHVDAASLYEHGETNWQTEVDAEAGEVTRQEGYGETPSQIYENYPVQLGLSHHSEDSPVYDGESAWSEFDWANTNPTDSAAAGTAMATGEKVPNGNLGMTADNEPLDNVAEHAQETGRSAGVVSDVPFGHATPASWAVQVENRNNRHEIADQMINGDLDLIIGAGHPLYDENAQPRDEADWRWLDEDQYSALQEGETDFTFGETNEDIRAVANGQVPERFFGVAPVAETLQYERESLAENEAERDDGREDGVPLTEDQEILPHSTEANDVVSLPEMTEAGLNVLSQDDEGMFLMVEAGAVDWAGHANRTTGNIEEMMSFNRSVETVHNWVEENSSWDETLLIVTSDHETGYLSGPDGGEDAEGSEWTMMSGEQGELPTDGWYSGDHTNHLVPLFAHGAGAEQLYGYVQGQDPVRGSYMDNVDVANIAFDLWEERPEDDDGEDDEGDEGEVSPEPWAESATYDTGDVVEHQGDEFEALWWTRNEVPGESSWSAWSEIGEPTECGDEEIPAWAESTEFQGGETVVHDNTVFEARWYSRNQEPGDPHGPWEEQGSC